MHFIFVSTFNLWRRAFVTGITKLSKEAVCVKAKAPADHVYQRRNWEEFKRVLRVAHASQPVKRAENLECRNQLSGVCWDAVYFSIESIFLNHLVLQNFTQLCIYMRWDLVPIILLHCIIVFLSFMILCSVWWWLYIADTRSCLIYNTKLCDSAPFFSFVCV